MLVPFVRLSVRLRLTPDFVSFLALLAAIGAGWSFYLAGVEPAFYVVGALFVLFNGLFDLLDGALAREMSIESPAGDLLDHVFDRYADIAIIAGLAAGIESYLLGFAAVTGVLMTSYLGTQAEAVGLSRVYGGLLGRADRLALTGLVTVVAAMTQVEFVGFTVIGWLLVIFAVVGHLTALQRFYYSIGDLDRS